MLIEGFVTLVTNRVGSKTSTCLRSEAGDMRTYSAPIVPGSSGAFPGQSSTTSGSSAARSEATQTSIRKLSVVQRMIYFPKISGGHHHSHRPLQPHERGRAGQDCRGHVRVSLVDGHTAATNWLNFCHPDRYLGID